VSSFAYNIFVYVYMWKYLFINKLIYYYCTGFVVRQIDYFASWNSTTITKDYLSETLSTACNVISVLRAIVSLDLAENPPDVSEFINPAVSSQNPGILEAKENSDGVDMMSVLEAIKALDSGPRIRSNRFEIEPWFRQQMWEFLILLSGIGPSAQRLSASISALKESLVPLPATPMRSFFSFETQQHRASQQQLHEAMVSKANEQCQQIDKVYAELTQSSLSVIANFSNGTGSKRMLVNFNYSGSL
jgi:hypothetical protein